ncbi:60S ribosomal protein L29 [Vermiconidia calcicola]|uniref:60S ribosomal protein L29 n=1 Tax=Vermiconidia calcicola TaxID=1690605 RepID=A0ACC3NMF2_9PEZI|nr:60S ribosomal protein L29 [Vermiconidia calcicola]
MVARAQSRTLDFVKPTSPQALDVVAQIHTSERQPHIVAMAKSKNSSQHNQAKKAHRNGIKKPKTHRYPSLKGTDPKFRRNHRHALHGTMKALKEVKEGKRDAA